MKKKKVLFGLNTRQAWHSFDCAFLFKWVKYFIRIDSNKKGFKMMHWMYLDMSGNGD